MSGDNLIYLFSLATIVIGTMHIGKMAYVRLNRNALLKGLKPKSLIYRHYHEFLSTNKLMVTIVYTLGASIILIVSTKDMLQTSSGKSFLVLGGVFVLITTVIGLIVSHRISKRILK